mmetsp:Transcript_3150/g.10534  ORF Transcript_3150/g.10534 Transcript_3150/m.10534 type:complete len:233 (+) Transcript_3150:863-1561(+)
MEPHEVRHVDRQHDAVAPRRRERGADVPEPERAHEHDVRGDVQDGGDDAGDGARLGQPLRLHEPLHAYVPRVEHQTGDERDDVPPGDARDFFVLPHREQQRRRVRPQDADWNRRERQDDERALEDASERRIRSRAERGAAQRGHRARHADHDGVPGDVSERRRERRARERERAEVTDERDGRERHDAVADHGEADGERERELRGGLAAEAAERARRRRVVVGRQPRRRGRRR